MATTITANGINFPDGSASAPSIGGTDTNTGLFTGSDIVGFATGGVERIKIDAQGDIFIGTTSDIAPANGTNLCVSDGTISRLILEKQSTIKFGLNVSNGFSIYDETNDAQRFGIASNGNVSIGNNPTTHADYILHIEDSGETNIKVEGSTSTLGARISLQNNDTTANAYSQYSFNDAGGQSTSAIQGINTDQTNNYGEIAFLTRNAQGTPPTERVRIDKDGKFGINTANPLATLHVAGDIYSTGDLQLTTDTSKILMGGANDLQLYHDGNHSYLKDTGGGNLKIDGSDNVELQAGGSTKAYTYANGLFVYDQQIPDNGYLNIGNGSDLKIFHDGNDSYIQQGGVGSLSLEASSYVDVRHTSAGTDPIFRMVNEANTSAGAVNVIRSIHDVRNCAEIRMGRNNDANDFSASAASTQGDIQFWTTQGGSLSRKGTFINSGGLCFGTDTAAANALDEYEEGSYNPAVQGSSSAGTGSNSHIEGFYTKIGNLVHLDIYINQTSHNGTGDVRITAPFTCKSDAQVVGSVMFDHVDFNSNFRTIASHIWGGSSLIGLYGTTDDASWGAVPMSGNLDSTVRYILSITYPAA